MVPENKIFPILAKGCYLMKKFKLLFVLGFTCILGLFLLSLSSGTLQNLEEDSITRNAVLSINQEKDITFVMPIKKGWITSDYGWKKNPFTGKKELHKGIDIAAPMGEEVYAVAEGKVLAVVSDPEPDSHYGKYILIMHSGKINSRYSQLGTVLVQKGQAVIAGELIGKVGKSGLSSGVHLHFEILVNDIPQDPRKYVDFKDREIFASKSR